MDIDKMLEQIQSHFGWERNGCYAYLTGVLSSVLTDEQSEYVAKLVGDLGKNS